MTRVESPPLVLYVERDRLGSLLCLWAFAIVAAVLWISRGTVILWFTGASLLVAAFVLLFRARVFAIDRSLGELRVLERTWPWRTKRTGWPLHELSVWVLVRPPVGSGPPHACVCLARGPDTLYTLRKSHSPEKMAELAERFARDLDRPWHAGPWT